MRFVCGQDAPEDLVVLPGDEWVVASAYAGDGGVRLIGVEDGSSVMVYPAEGAGTYPQFAPLPKVFA